MRKRKRGIGDVQYEYFVKDTNEHPPTMEKPKEEEVKSFTSKIENDEKRRERIPNKNSESFLPSQKIKPDSKKNLNTKKAFQKVEKPSEKGFDQNEKKPKIISRGKNMIEGKNESKDDCPICYTSISPHSKIWSCVQCYHPFHLQCLKKWISKSNEEPKEKEKSIKAAVWTCPHCCYYYSGRLPEYFCFCGKVKNPEFNRYSIPHSCGDNCGKFRGNNCNHPCNLECHPGPCPPCHLYSSKVECYCGKETKPIKCSESDTTWACENFCGKLLNCKKHYCKEKCHEGACNICQIKIIQQCRCKKQERQVNCGNSVFNCQKECGKKLDCGEHSCHSICHEGKCETCPLSPNNCHYCPCGKMELDYISTTKRTKCTDPIPNCGLPCRKTLKCGIHQCKESCHSGPCAECDVLVEKACRCNSKIFKVKCSNSQIEFPTCEKVCKKKKSCNKHSCEELCCPSKNQRDETGMHLCLKVCNKPLACGNHRCELFCHLGYCKPCPIYINEELRCFCGKSVKNPPLPCGTKKPECHEICGKVLGCGHKCAYTCHDGECKVCIEIIPKSCICGKEKFDDSVCGKIPRCNYICAIVLKCGHKCQIDCHIHPNINENDEIQGCGQKCNKLKDCGHKCLELCHPNHDCSKICQTEIKFTCECKNREYFHRCDEADLVSLPCNEQCERLKRFGDLIEESKKHRDKAFYHPQVLKYGKNNFLYVKKLEDKIEKFMKSDKNYMDLDLGAGDNGKKIFLQALLSQHYKFTLQFYWQTKNPFVSVIKDANVKFPPIPLTEYIKKVHKGEITPHQNPFEAIVKILGVSKTDQIDELDKLLLEYREEYYQEAFTGYIYLFFWNKEKAENARIKLKNSFSSFNNVYLEITPTLQSPFDIQESELKAKSPEYIEVRSILNSLLDDLFGKNTKIECKSNDEELLKADFDKLEITKEDQKTEGNIFNKLQEFAHESDNDDFIAQ